MATVEELRTAKAMCAYAMQLASDADRAVRIFGAPMASYLEARRNLEVASALLERITAELSAEVLAAERERTDEEAHELEVTSEFEGSVCISRGMDSVYMTTEEAERLLADLPNAIRMSR